MGDFTNLSNLFKIYNSVSKEKLGKLLNLESSNLNNLLDRFC